ncbi:MAG: hypothetical protein HUJ31_10565 [Pseudomonadales bacterium]|nr:hypothetical protein [Pseudomonadales bacterium]
MCIEEQIIDVDGSCRDINVPDVGRSEAVSLLNLVKASFELRSAADSEGHELSVDGMIERLSASESETILSCWTCEGLISPLQIFFSWNKDTNVFVELTFFPQDVDSREYSLTGFLDWLRPVLVALNTSKYFVRYENASWQYGDTSETSGVIFTNVQHAVNG